mmetsp:Transcript_15639/g.43754  ORF Transcript_15639/g.43754 Transcript_15639/m.43754 type:complete len:83 (-) Transcript_15639:3-251(-)
MRGIATSSRPMQFDFLHGSGQVDVVCARVQKRRPIPVQSKASATKTASMNMPRSKVATANGVRRSISSLGSVGDESVREELD